MNFHTFVILRKIKPLDYYNEECSSSTGQYVGNMFMIILVLSKNYPSLILSEESNLGGCYKYCEKIKFYPGKIIEEEITYFKDASLAIKDITRKEIKDKLEIERNYISEVIKEWIGYI